MSSMRQARDEIQAFLAKPGDRVAADFYSQPCGEEKATDDDDLETDFYKDVAVGAEIEFGEIAVGEEALEKLLEQNDDPFHKKIFQVSAVIFHYTKYYFSLFLFMLLGPILAIVWGLVLSVSKFLVSWTIYPIVKILKVWFRPMRSLVRIALWPYEPIYELLSRCFPTVHFSLWSSKPETTTVVKKNRPRKREQARPRSF